MQAFVPSLLPLSRPVNRSTWTGTQPVNRVLVPQGVRRAIIRHAVVCTGAPVEAAAENFEEEVLESDLPVLVDFYAPWCGPCKLIAPLMDWAATEFEGQLKVVKVETEENDDFVKKYNIHGLPTLAVFRDGEPHGVQEGAIGKKQLEQYIMRHVPEVIAQPSGVEDDD